MAEEVQLRITPLYKLAAADPYSDEILRGLTKGKTYKAILTLKRNAALHDKYFVLLGFVFRTQSIYQNIDDMREDITIALGYYRTVTSWDGTTKTKAKSVSFAKMDGLEFEKLYNRTLDFVALRIIPGVDKADLVRELEKFMTG
ncbi:MAG: DUF1367 family protein [Gammaproteobacteria bacterium]|nr:DUF1367 family protein [Gammaproteobacteria bacterium]